MKYSVPFLLVYCCLFIILAWFYFKPNETLTLHPFFQTNEDKNIDVKNVSDLKLKYILQWTDSNTIPFVYMGKGREGFIRRECPFTNCFVTSDKNLLGDYTNFDVIAFAGPQLTQLRSSSLPKMRSPHQKYAFASLESGDYYPICHDNFNNYFNWTWTFKLDSDVRWGYITIRDKENKVIGPNKDIKWIPLKDMEPVNSKLKEKLRKKTKAAAWFVSNCKSRSNRENYVQQLQMELKNYNLSVDIYGKCGPLKCKDDGNNSCGKIIQDQYYFYLSFENSFAEDYVTEKLVTALLNNAVPIVYGAANYTRFLPDGSYINARELSVQSLATKMIELIQNPESYFDYFRWQNHYSYNNRDKTIDTNTYCGLCTLLNNAELVNKKSSYKNFKEWWTPSGRC